jgi:hypothetical protein
MKKLLIFTLVFTLAFSLLAFAVANDEEIEEEIRELREKEGGREREVEVKIELDKVKIVSKLEKEGVEGEIENKFKIEFSTEEEVKIKLEYEEESEVNLTEFETELEQKVKFLSLIEFVDANNNSLYDKGEEVFVYSLKDANFTSPTYSTGLTPNNITEHVISAQSVDGIFRITLHAVGDFANIKGEVVKPTEVKVDLEISNFPFTREDSTLALRTKVESVMEVETEKKVENGEERVTVETKEGFVGFFSWRKTALINGVEREVKSTPLEDEEVYLIYEKGSSIVHDPKIGFTTPTPVFLPPIPTSAWIGVIGGVMAILGYLLYRKLRR